MKINNLLSKPLALASLILSLSPISATAEFSWEDYYTITDIPLDKDIDPQIGGLAMNAKGQLVACFHRGEVATYNAETKTWKTFARGLHEPLGIYVEEDGAILVIQRPELTRLRDKDGDGVADVYETVCSDWGMSGNYHEFTFGLVKDSQKNIYITLGTASNGSGVREEVRGPWLDVGGLKQQDFFNNGSGDEWNIKKTKLPRMYSRVPYRGCVLQIQPGNPKAIMYATGLRTPNGLYMDDNDQLWVSDNQGDWVGASKIHRIEKGGFHGHPASLSWGPNPPKVTPADLPAKQLDSMRIKASALLPQGDAGNSITQILPYSENFAPLTKDPAPPEQLLVGEMNHSRLIRYMPDTVNGKVQGTVTHMINTPLLNHGNNRLLYSPDGKSLYTGKTHLSWPGREGLKKITYNGKPYLLADQVKLTKTGFQFTFNAPITAPEELTRYIVKSYGTDYHSSYGSQKTNQKLEDIAKISIDKNTLIIDLKNPPIADKIYDITLSKKVTSKLSDISSTRFWYTAHQVLKDE
ncbi:MAG: DUF7133 domain-containing protein [Akkermansiaceae bacterium]